MKRTSSVILSVAKDLNRCATAALPAAILILLALVSAPAAGQQLAVLKKIPADTLSYIGGARPDTQGMVSYNQGRFRSPEFQRGAMRFMIRSILKGNGRGVADAWRAIDATFAEQTDIGNFAGEGGPAGGPSAAALWLCDLDQAILVLRESQFFPEYKTRIELLIPKIRKAAQWLAQRKYQERLERDDAEAPNRLLFDALAYGLSGILTGDRQLQQTGRRFVDLAMNRYRASDGVFLEKDGHDSSYQAVAAMNLQVWLIYFPDEKLQAAADKAVAWEIGRVKPDGEIDIAGNTRTGLEQERWMGRFKDVNLSEITFCLLYYYARTSNADALSAARRIIERRKA